MRITAATDFPLATKYLTTFSLSVSLRRCCQRGEKNKNNTEQNLHKESLQVKFCRNSWNPAVRKGAVATICSCEIQILPLFCFRLFFCFSRVPYVKISNFV